MELTPEAGSSEDAGSVLDLDVPPDAEPPRDIEALQDAETPRDMEATGDSEVPRDAEVVEDAERPHDVEAPQDASPLVDAEAPHDAEVSLDASPLADAEAPLDAVVDSTITPDAAPIAAPCVDTAPPTRPGRPQLLATEAGVELTWAASTDAFGVDHYLVYRDGVFLAESEDTQLLDDTPMIPSSTHAYWVFAVDTAGNRSARGPGASIAAPTQEEGLDDNVDDDGDGWLETSYGFRVRARHPRMAMSPQQLDEVIARMSGPDAREPYASWYAEALAGDRGPVTSALVHLATGEQAYLDEVIDAINAASSVGFELLLATDLLFDALPQEALQHLRGLVNDDDNIFGYATRRFIAEAIEDPRARFMNNQHAIQGLRMGILYAGVFAFTDADAQPGVDNPFPSVDLLRAIHNNAQPEGWMWRNENHISGDLEIHPDRLPGSPGGMYDNLGYDSGEESNTVWFWAFWRNISGQQRHLGAYHDESRGRFWFAMRVPHSEARSPSAEALGPFCGDAPLGARHVRVFTPTATSYPGPSLSTRAVTASLYQDPIMQHYSSEQICSGRWNSWQALDLLYFDDSLMPFDPATMPRASYFAGPGIVTSRSDATPRATLGVLLAGVGYGRRYEDASSFIVHRRGPVVVHASKRARSGAHSEASFWYHVHGASKNGLRIYDPLERRCGDPEAPLLVISDALGGPIFERGGYSDVEGVYSLSNGNSCLSEALDEHVGGRLGAEVVRFEAAPDYSYALVDAQSPYRAKVERFERAMVHIGADQLLLFDRVTTRNPEARRVWAAHIAPDPVQGDAEATFGALRFGEAEAVAFSGDDEVLIQALLPTTRDVIVRGGATVLSEGPLGAGEARDEADALPQPRWLLLRADVSGAARVLGRDAEGALLDEVVNIAQGVNDEQGGYAGNTAARFSALTRVEAIDAFGQLSVTIPHRYDTPDVSGFVRDFEPGREGNEARPDGREFGRHTIEIEDLGAEGSISHFLISLSLADAGVAPARFTLAEGEGLVAAISGDAAWVFTTDRAQARGRVELPPSVSHATVFGLGVNLDYEVSWGEALSVEPSPGGAACSSSAGTLRLSR